jgi:hypothetical protein
MARVWTLAGAVALGCILIYLTVGFMGKPTLEYSSAIVGAGAVAAYLPGPNNIARGLFLLLGVLFGSLSFLLGALAFPDTLVGLLLGALVPILFSALASMATRRPETLAVMLLGAGSMGALYTRDFFNDPQSLNFTLPIAIGQVVVAIGLGYLLGVLAHDLGPQAPAEETAGMAQPADDTPEGWAPYPNVREDATVGAPVAAPASPTEVTTVQPTVTTATDKEVTA